MKRCFTTVLFAAFAVLSMNGTLKAQTAPQNVSYCDLAKSPKEFTAKPIRVRAVYRYTLEMERLEASECCPTKGAWIWFEFGEKEDRSSRRVERKFPKGTGLVLATFEGVLEGPGNYGDGGYRFKFIVHRVTNLEHAVSPKPYEDFPWAPFPCPD
jgi:hypothetical protein